MDILKISNEIRSGKYVQKDYLVLFFQLLSSEGERLNKENIELDDEMTKNKEIIRVNSTNELGESMVEFIKEKNGRLAKRLNENIDLLMKYREIEEYLRSR